MAGRAEPPLGPRRRILESYWENNNNLQGGKKGRRKNQLPTQVKIALVINGEFLVSVSSGRMAGPWDMGMGGRSRGPGLGGPPTKRLPDAVLDKQRQRALSASPRDGSQWCWSKWGCGQAQPGRRARQGCPGGKGCSR